MIMNTYVYNTLVKIQNNPPPSIDNHLPGLGVYHSPAGLALYFHTYMCNLQRYVQYCFGFFFFFFYLFGRTARHCGTSPPGVEPLPPVVEATVLTSRPPGKSCFGYFKHFMNNIYSWVRFFFFLLVRFIHFEKFRSVSFIFTTVQYSIYIILILHSVDKHLDYFQLFYCSVTNCFYKYSCAHEQTFPQRIYLGTELLSCGVYLFSP